ncbi:MAG: 16S rRNA processing protein RimM [Gemmatimonadetes bacterium]|nr:16S rRNA processing protein RimM [Gemmatimonadota bacterium]
MGRSGSSSSSEPRFLVVGHLNKPHGTKGELFVWPLTDHPESVYAPGVSLLVGDAEGFEPDPAVGGLRIVAVRPFRNGYLVTLQGVRDRNRAEELRGRYLMMPIESLAPLERGQVFYHQLLGMEVVTKEGERVGEIAEVYELRPAAMLEVHGPDGDVMIPYLSHIVVEVDTAARRMVIDPPEGLLDL